MFASVSTLSLDRECLATQLKKVRESKKISFVQFSCVLFKNFDKISCDSVSKNSTEVIGVRNDIQHDIFPLTSGFKETNLGSRSRFVPFGWILKSSDFILQTKVALQHRLTQCCPDISPLQSIENKQLVRVGFIESHN